MKFHVPNYSCLKNPCLRGYRLQIPVLSFLCPRLNLLNSPPPEQNSWVRHWWEMGCSGAWILCELCNMTPTFLVRSPVIQSGAKLTRHSMFKHVTSNVKWLVHHPVLCTLFSLISYWWPRYRIQFMCLNVSCLYVNEYPDVLFLLHRFCKRPPPKLIIHWSFSRLYVVGVIAFRFGMYPTYE